MVVTGIVASPRKEGRFELMVDGKGIGLVSLDLVDRLALRVGTTFDEARRAAVDEAIGALATYDRALNVLAAQPRSQRDLRRRLIQKGEPEARVDAAIARLVASGVLNDESFARQLTRSRVLGRGASRRRVRDELYRKGVAGSAADAAIAEVFEEESVDEATLVEAAARKKLRTLGATDAVTRRRRLYGFLARRGFDGASIRETLARLLPAGGAESLDDVLAGDDEVI